jgi:lambda family phage minor tail protein L
MTNQWANIVETYNPTGYVELFTLDTTGIDPTYGTVYRFTPMNNGAGSNISFGGFTYTALPIRATGFALAAGGTAPRPKLQLPNPNGAFTFYIEQAGEWVGATVTRIRTHVQFLDGQPDADGTQHSPSEVYYIEQQTAGNSLLYEWELRWATDRQGQMLPGRQILKDFGFPGVSVQGIN